MPDPRPPTYKRVFTTTIAESKEESIKDEEKDEADIKVYTDGSGYEGNVGTAAVLYRNSVAATPAQSRLQAIAVIGLSRS